MKLRTRGPPRRADEDADQEAAEMPPPSANRRAARKSTAPRAAPEPARTPARSRPRAAPKGGVQKRKSVRPTARPRTAAPTPSRSCRRAARPPLELPPPAADDHLDEDEADGVAEADAKVQDAEQPEMRVVKATGPTTIDDLPEEVMLGIFSYFRPPQLCWKIGRVCRRWASWSVAPFLWRGKEYTLSPDPNLSSRRKGKA